MHEHALLDATAIAKPREAYKISQQSLVPRLKSAYFHLFMVFYILKLSEFLVLSQSIRITINAGSSFVLSEVGKFPRLVYRDYYHYSLHDGSKSSFDKPKPINNRGVPFGVLDLTSRNHNHQ